MNIENNHSNFYMYLISIVGIGMCIFVFQIGYETCMKKCGIEDPISEIFDKKEDEEEYKDIEMEHVLHKCSKCKKGMGKNTNVYCYMDKHFCTELCRDQYFHL
jgi:hypothetical protein